MATFCEAVPTMTQAQPKNTERQLYLDDKKRFLLDVVLALSQTIDEIVNQLLSRGQTTVRYLYKDETAGAITLGVIPAYFMRRRR